MSHRPRRSTAPPVKYREDTPVNTFPSQSSPLSLHGSRGFGLESNAGRRNGPSREERHQTGQNSEMRHTRNDPFTIEDVNIPSPTLSQSFRPVNVGQEHVGQQYVGQQDTKQEQAEHQQTEQQNQGHQINNSNRNGNGT